MSLYNLDPQSVSKPLQALIADQRLPLAYLDQVHRWLVPLADQLAHQFFHQQQMVAGPLVVGISGAQGTGKSTTAAVLALLLKQGHGLDVINVSIDDYYLSFDARQQLATQVHPLLATRGVPGTHNHALGIEQLTALKAGTAGVCLPSFNKATDDIGPFKNATDKAADIIFFEGWCVGSPPYQLPLSPAVNDLEANEDKDGVWRRYLVDALNGPYQDWFRLIDTQLFLRAPSMSAVRQWRALQESKLHLSAVFDDGIDRRFDADQVDRFVDHFQRLTQFLLDEQPKQAHWVATLGQDQQIVQVNQNKDVFM